MGGTPNEAPSITPEEFEEDVETFETQLDEPPLSVDILGSEEKPKE
jgi:hypothetical protein